MINFNKLNLTTILLPQFSAFLLSVVRVFCYLHCSLILLLHSQARWLYIFHLRIDRAQELKSFVYQCRECSECLIIFHRRGFCKQVIRKNLDQDSSLIKRHVYGLRVSQSSQVPLTSLDRWGYSRMSLDQEPFPSILEQYQLIYRQCMLSLLSLGWSPRNLQALEPHSLPSHN